MNAVETESKPLTIAGREFRDRLAGEDLLELVPSSPQVILDCGAGAGSFARDARTIWPQAAIYSFEPATRFNTVLQPLDQSHHVERRAVGNHNGPVRLNITVGPESNSFLPYMPNSPLCRILQESGHETVEMVRLDDWILPGSACDLLKLDLQGYEIEALRGAEQTIQRCKPVIYCEVSFQRQYQNQPLIEDVDAYLQTQGYRRLHLYASPMPDVWGDAIYVYCGLQGPISAASSVLGSKPIRLNIGAGDTVIDGFVAIDRKLGTEAYPLAYADGSVEEIRCVHMLEHLSFSEVLEALKEWHRVLKPGGRLRISVPDAVQCAKLSASDPHWRFYLMGGQTDHNDFHKSCWDEPTLETYLQRHGFSGVRKWTSENTDLAASDISLNLEGFKSQLSAPLLDDNQQIKIRAIVGMPRIGWNDSWQSITEAFHPLRIPLQQHQGCFWAQNIQKGFERAVRDGIDWLITLDYDSMILPMHVNRLLDILGQNPEIDAIAALQMRRGAETPLFSTGLTEAAFDGRPYQVQTAHFGLTVLRVECLKNMPKPWLIDIPDENGEFNGNHTDADITFWRNWTKAGHTVYIAPDVRIGHLELLVSEYDDEFKPRHFHVGDWWERHAKAGHCMRSRIS